MFLLWEEKKQIDGEMSHNYVYFLVTCQIVWPLPEEGFGGRVSSWSLITHSRMVLLWTEVGCGLFKNRDRGHSRRGAAQLCSDHTADSSCDFLSIMNLCLIFIHLAAVCAGGVCGTVVEDDFPSVSTSSWCHFAHIENIQMWVFMSSYYVKFFPPYFSISLKLFY